MATHKDTTDHSSFATNNCFRPPCPCTDVAVTNALQAVRHLWEEHGGYTDRFPNDDLPMTCLEPSEGFAVLDAMRNPWLWSKVKLPCKCKHLITPNALLVIQHIYDEHIQKRGDWNLDVLQEFVDEVTGRWLETPAATEWILSRPDEQPRLGRICRACGDPLPIKTADGQDCKSCRRRQKRDVN